jgi:GTP-binding protein
MKMGETDSADKFMVLVVEYFTYLFLCEREYELQIGQPQVIIKEIDGKKMSQLKS